MSSSVSVAISIIIVSFSGLLPSPISADDFSFSNEVCYGANAPKYSQDATQSALNNILADMREYPDYVLFCADGNQQNYKMHAQAGCASTSYCYDCVEAAKEYLWNNCGGRLGARVSEDSGRCYIRFENYYIDMCPPFS
ncbi:hypothetical protein LINGRAHAP2_LOCUS6014 [Linum grandiflorum]